MSACFPPFLAPPLPPSSPPHPPFSLSPLSQAQEEELLALLKVKDHPVCYDGFEPSGRMHIAQGILKAINVNRLTRAGCVFKFWVADWFALLNNKMGGDLKKIRTVGQYMIEVWRAAGMEMDNVEFLWASDEINARPNDYWLRVMDIARRNNVPRIVRCCTIMGRSETDDLSAAQIFYPCMQCADIFFLKVREREREKEVQKPRTTQTNTQDRPRPTDRWCSHRHSRASIALSARNCNPRKGHLRSPMPLCGAKGLRQTMFGARGFDLGALKARWPRFCSSASKGVLSSDPGRRVPL